MTRGTIHCGKEMRFNKGVEECLVCGERIDFMTGDILRPGVKHV